MPVAITISDVRAIDQALTPAGKQLEWQVVFALDGERMLSKAVIKVAAPSVLEAEIEARKELKLFLHEAVTALG